jgi:O-antigen ligase
MRADRVFFEFGYRTLGIMLAINLISIIGFPSGIMTTAYYHNSIYFLGMKNGFSEVIIPYLLLLFISYYKKIIGKSTLFAGSALSLLTISLSYSTTGLLAVLTFFTFILFSKNRGENIKKYKWVIIGCVCMTIALVFFRIQEYFSYFIEGVLGKSVTLTNRTIIWDEAFKLITEKPILGRGLNLKTGNILVGQTYYYSHNMIIEILVSTGILGLLSYATIYLNILKSIIRKRERSEIYNVLFSSLIAFFVCSIAEAPVLVLYQYLIIMLLSNYSLYGERKNESI